MCNNSLQNGENNADFGINDETHISFNRYIEKIKTNTKKLPRLFFEEPDVIILSYWVPGKFQPRRYFTFDINDVPKWDEIDDIFVSYIFHAFIINNTSVWRIPSSRKKYVVPKFKKLFTN